MVKDLVIIQPLSQDPTNDSLARGGWPVPQNLGEGTVAVLIPHLYF